MLEALAREGITEISVYSDGPRTPDDEPAVRQIRHTISTVDWARIRLVERERNLGLAQSVLQGVTEMFGQYDAVVVLEDDCIPRPGFRLYMERSLTEYRDVNSVGCISGFGPSGVYRPFGAPDGYFTGRISSWGWGTWRRSWALVAPNWDEVRRNLRSETVEWDLVGHDLKGFLEPSQSERIGSRVWTPLWLFPLLFRDILTLYPYRSYIDNVGFDDVGENCGVKSLRPVPELSRPVNPMRFRYPRKIEVNTKIARSFAYRVLGLPNPPTIVNRLFTVAVRRMRGLRLRTP